MTSSYLTTQPIAWNDASHVWRVTRSAAGRRLRLRHSRRRPTSGGYPASVAGPATRDHSPYDSSADGASGALVTFVGIVRADACAGAGKSRRVRALDYEAHREMAERQLERLVDAAKQHWPLDMVRIQHRLGIVGAGEAGVVVAVAAPHRAEAYAASQFLIERLKRDVPIWKRELYDDGTSRWVGHADV